MFKVVNSKGDVMKTVLIIAIVTGCVVGFNLLGMIGSVVGQLNEVLSTVKG